VKLLVRNDLGNHFEHDCTEFIGYEVFVLAREHWGYDWNTYMVLNGSEILENVINPNSLDPQSAQMVQ
jgi:hypothetical protein